MPKTHIRLEAYGTVDELNSYLGLLQTYLTEEADKRLVAHVQNKLFSVGSYLATDQSQTELRMESRINDKDITLLEQAIDEIDNALTPLHAFILPGGARGAAVCHICRTVCSTGWAGCSRASGSRASSRRGRCGCSASRATTSARPSAGSTARGRSPCSSAVACRWCAASSRSRRACRLQRRQKSRC
mgnify:CR=1 FL=1